MDASVPVIEHTPPIKSVPVRSPLNEEYMLFLNSARALALCGREFERVADEIAKRVSDAGLLLATYEVKAEIRRSPGRCIVQVGPVALTTSWVRARVNTATEGRLLIVEWLGIVARGNERIPERVAIAAGAVPTSLRESVLKVQATSERDWRWCREAATSINFSAGELAELCVSSLLEEFKSRLTPVA